MQTSVRIKVVKTAETFIRRGKNEAPVVIVTQLKNTYVTYMLVLAHGNACVCVCEREKEVTFGSDLHMTALSPSQLSVIE